MGSGASGGLCTFVLRHRGWNVQGTMCGGHNIRVEIPGPLLGYELRKSSSTCAGHGPVCLSTLQLVALRMNVTAGEFKLKSESPPEYSGREVLLRSSRACSDIARSVYEIAKAAGISPKARSRIACGQQVGESSAYRLGVIPTKPEQYCFAMLKAFDAEANDQKNSAQWLIDYVRGTGIPLGSYVPYGVIELVDSKNSIGGKWRAVTEDASCARWWIQANENMCGIP
ncbi:hypothetical protein D3C81_252680 [compost metagenome]